jgi:hypothetical protein
MNNYVYLSATQDPIGIPGLMETSQTNLRGTNNCHLAPGFMRFRYGASTDLIYVARSAVVTGKRAARSAGRSPPIRPIASAQITPSTARYAVTLS